ncbi:kin of IRRE-like protein 1 isoform X2 [Ischnura elegans]|uniref:kin of IRRE-like protein 1 isoform X2 n=1 Tax=Ischnura elegans TaxID=197161 RepID=UPI001ED87421|nr:kin of IRRE-like protein 1 isoform X2 [Ischnura elegans]
MRNMGKQKGVYVDYTGGGWECCEVSGRGEECSVKISDTSVDKIDRFAENYSNSSPEMTLGSPTCGRMDDFAMGLDQMTTTPANTTLHLVPRFRDETLPSTATAASHPHVGGAARASAAPDCASPLRSSPRSLLLLLTTCSRNLLHQLRRKPSTTPMRRDRYQRTIDSTRLRPGRDVPLQSPGSCSRGRHRNSRSTVPDESTTTHESQSFADRLPSCSLKPLAHLPLVMVVTAFILMLSPAASAEQKFAMQPMDQTAVVNSKVTLPCRVIGRAGMPQWTKDDFALGTDRNLSGFERYAMIGSDEEGDYSLEIHPVRLEDDARYQCQVSAGSGGEPGIRSRFATLTVLVPPEPPRILPQPGDTVSPASGTSTSTGHGSSGSFSPSNPMSLMTTEDREIQLECVSKGGKPAAEITWIDGTGNVLKDGVEYMTELLPDKKRVTAKSILRLTPRREHHRQVFTCQAQNAADRTYRSAKVMLLVKYAPKVTVAVSAIRRPTPAQDDDEEGGGASALAGGPSASVVLSSSTAMASSSSGTHSQSVTTVNSGALIREFDEVRLTCMADANPDTDLIYRWFINDEPVTGGVLSGTGLPPDGASADIIPEGGVGAVAVDPTMLVIANVSRGFHDAIVKCEVHNAVGKSEESETLDISYGPRFRVRPQSVEAEEGSTVSMSCDVDGNPPADIVWIHEPTEKVVGTSPNLTLHAGLETAGRYRCTARVPTPHVQSPVDRHRGGPSGAPPPPPQEFPVATAYAWLRLRGPPIIVSRKVQFGVRGDTVRLECVALSVPRPERVVWTRAGRDVDANDRDFSVLEDPLPEGIKSTLIIRDSHDDHFGPYNCSVTNPYGSDGLEITLKMQKTLPLLLIIFGIIGGIAFLVVVAMITLWCQKKSKKGDAPDEEKQTKVAGAVIGQGQGGQLQQHHVHHVVHTHQSDRSSNDSDLKVEIRTASSLSNTLNERDSTGPWCEDEEDEDDGEVRISAVDDVDVNGMVTSTGVLSGGPVVLGPRLSLMTAGGELGFRYSAAGGGSIAPEYPEPTFPPKPDGTSNNGYVPYVDYARDYNPPPPPSIHDALRGKSTIPPPPPSYGATVDPRYNATYGNPYLRTPPPPPLSSGGSNNSLPQPPTSHTLNLTDPPMAGSPVSSAYTPTTSSYATSTLPSSASNYGISSTGPLANSGNPASYGTLKAGTTPPPAASSSSTSSSPSGTLTCVNGNKGSLRNGAVPQVARLPTSPTRHYIVPSHHQQPSVVKRGTLATHV